MSPGPTAAVEQALSAAERHVAALEGQAGPSEARLTHARRLVARWEARLGLCRERDRRQAERQALSPDHEDCHCLGAGGSGARVGLSVLGADGRPVLARVDGVPRWTYERLCDCPDGQALAIEVSTWRLAAQDQLRAARVARIAGAAEIPKRHAWQTLETWATSVKHGGGTADQVNAVLDPLREWEYMAQRGTLDPLLLLAGHQGVGKSGLAAALAQTWIDRERSVLYRSVPRLAAQLRAAPWRAKHEPDALPTELELLDALSEADLLVLDDLGAEGAAGAGAEILNGLLFDILQARMAEGRPTIVTTNLTGDEVMRRYGARIYDRLYAPSLAEVVEVAVPNLRWPAS